MKQSKLRSINQKLGYHFKNANLLTEALTHRSITSASHNERLEFLGDTVLNTIISTALFKRYSEATEGLLSHMRAMLVCESQLAELAQQLGLGQYLDLAPSLKKQGGDLRPSLLANALEAVIGAMYLDSQTQFSNFESYILKWYEPCLNELSITGTAKDPKTMLQEYLQARKWPTPHYYLVQQTGTAHEPIFEITCELNNPQNKSQFIRHTSTGKTRREAEKLAAALVLKELQMIEPDGLSKSVFQD